MAQHQQTTVHPAAPAAPACPTCGAPLAAEGELLRCAEHGAYFRYGPRLLVHVAHEEGVSAPLLPWQTLGEPAAR